MVCPGGKASSLQAFPARQPVSKSVQTAQGKGPEVETSPIAASPPDTSLAELALKDSNVIKHPAAPLSCSLKPLPLDSPALLLLAQIEQLPDHIHSVELSELNIELSGLRHPATMAMAACVACQLGKVLLLWASCLNTVPYSFVKKACTM